MVSVMARAIKDGIIRYLPSLRKKEYAFAFLVHPRDINDLYKKYPFFKYLSENSTLWFLKRFWPVVVSKIEGFTSLKSQNPVKGFIITTPLTAKQILENKELARKKIRQALILAEKIGVKLIGLGAFNSSITKGGEELLGKTKLAVTNGNALTAGMAITDINNIIQNKKTTIQQTSIAIIGATGSIGQVIGKIFAAEQPKELILIGKTPSHLQSLKKEILDQYPKINLLISTDIEKIKNADIIVVATASINAIVKAHHLKENSVIYDISQPRNTDPDIPRSRPDVLILEGGLVSTPGINYHVNFGLPKEVAFACLAETMLLGAEQLVNDCSIGIINSEQVKKINALALKYNFKTYLAK